jgi:hypothetical protein
MGLMRKVKKGLFPSAGAGEYGQEGRSDGAYRKEQDTDDERADAKLILRILYGRTEEASIDERLEKLAVLRERGIITTAEYEQMKQDLVGNAHRNELQ